MLFERALVAEGAIAVIANGHVDENDEFSSWNLLFLSSRLGSRRFIRFEVATAVAPSNLPAGQERCCHFFLFLFIWKFLIRQDAIFGI